jgi:hypothetical protein
MHMRMSHTVRYAAVAFALGAVSLLAASNASSAADAQDNAIQDGKAGFVVYEWGNAGARGPTVCPNGRSLGYRQIFEQSSEGKRHEGESDADFGRRLEAGGYRIAVVNGQNLCALPALAPDPHYRTMDDTHVAAYGIDLDGQVSTRKGHPASGTCPHDDFRGVEGEQGVDNQYLRLVGCTGTPPKDTGANYTGWLPPPQEHQENTMLEGGWGILISLRGVNNLQNDDSVEVGIYANADPIQLSANKSPIMHVTYAADQDPRFRGETHGRIVNGVLTTEPVNVRFHWLVAGFHLERPVDHARIRAKFNADGTMEGYLAGYTPIEAVYDMQYGFRNAKDDAGRPVPSGLTSGLATGGSSAMGRTCNGAYAALHALADGDRDLQTGQCTSISTQYFFRATPAFVVDVQTRGANDALIKP